MSACLHANEELVAANHSKRLYSMCWVCICRTSELILGACRDTPPVSADKNHLLVYKPAWIPSLQQGALVEAFRGTARWLVGCSSRCPSQDLQAWISPHKKSSQQGRMWLWSKSDDKGQDWMQIFYTPNWPSPNTHTNTFPMRERDVRQAHTYYHSAH